MEAKRLNSKPQTLTPSSRGRRRRSNASDCTSPEFEFWMVRNPSFPPPNLITADELFSNGFILPLHLLSLNNKPDLEDRTHQPNLEPPNIEHESEDSNLELGLGPKLSAAITESSSTALSVSKRWKDIFKRSEKKIVENCKTEVKEKEKEKLKKIERKGGSCASSPSAELNINIWPFSLSRSAGNAGNGPKLFPGAPRTRKVNSAPCSRSNSAGESKSRKWPSSPARAGVHVGRSSPVWQVRRESFASESSEHVVKGSRKEASKGGRNKVVSTNSRSSKARVLNLNIPTWIGYRHHMNCRSDENGAVGVVLPATNGGANMNIDNNDGGGSDGSSSGNIFNLRNLFTKKIAIISH